MPSNITPDTPVVDPLAAAPGELPRKRPRSRGKVAAGGAVMPANIPETAPRLSVGESVVCPAGHAAVEKEHKFCPECGLRTVAVVATPKCRNGHEVTADQKFCPECGAQVIRPVADGPDDPRPKPAAELTPDELRERERLHAEAIRRGKESPVMAFAPGKAPPSVRTVILHFVADGFTAFGNVWVRGQEIEIWPGHPRWEEAQLWINMDTAEQYRRWGKEYFRLGPWPGERTYLAGIGRFQQLRSLGDDGKTVGQPTEEELRAGDEAERRRARRVPAPPRW